MSVTVLLVVADLWTIRFIGVGRFRILGGPRVRLLGGGGGGAGGAKFPAGT